MCFKNLNWILSILFFSGSYVTSYADSCIVILGDKSSPSSESTSLVPVPATSNQVITFQDALAELQEPVFEPSSLADFSSDLSSKMATSGLIHSNFFTHLIINKATKKITKESIPTYIASLSPTELNSFSNSIYEAMTSITDRLVEGEKIPGILNEKLASEILLKKNPSEVIDKIGEALIVISTSGGLINLVEDINSKVVASSKKGKIKMIATGAGAVVVAGMGLYTMGEMMLISVGLEGLAGTLGFFSWKNRGKNLVQTSQKEGVGALKDNTEKVRPYLTEYNFYQKPEKDIILAELNALEDYILNGLGEDRKTETQDVYIGRKVGHLRKRLNFLFNVEFSKWVSATQSRTLKIMDDPKSVIESKNREEEFNILEMVLIEAVEVAEKISEISELITLAIEDDIEKIEEIFPKKIQEDAHMKLKEHLGLGKSVQIQFTGTMELVLRSLKESILALRFVSETDAQLLTADVLGTINGDTSDDEIDDDESDPVGNLVNKLQALNKSLVSLSPDKKEKKKESKQLSSKSLNQHLTTFRSEHAIDKTRLQAAEKISHGVRELSLEITLEIFNNFPSDVNWGWKSPSYYYPHVLLETYGMTTWSSSNSFASLELDVLLRLIEKTKVTHEDLEMNLNELKELAIALAKKSNSFSGKKEEYKGEILSLIEVMIQEKITKLNKMKKLRLKIPRVEMI